MIVRPAAPEDHAALRDLYEAYEAERPEPEHRAEDPERGWAGAARIAREGGALLAEDERGAVGFVLAELRGPGHGFVRDLYVRPEARRAGAATRLLREANARLREGGARAVTLEVEASNEEGRRFYERLGFRTELLVLEIDADELERSTAEREREVYGTVHVQTDDRPRVEGAVSRFVPRLGRSDWTEVSDPHDGWIAVADDLCGREPELLRRLARELSDRLGGVALALGVEDAVVRYVLFDRGRVMDEYQSVPEYFGPLPPGDVVALAANPTVVARLTGADPARVRDAAPTAASPAELPPAAELYARIAGVMGLTLPA